MTDAQPTKEEKGSDAYYLNIFSMMTRPTLELQCLAYLRQADINAKTVVAQANALRKQDKKLRKLESNS